MSIKPPSRYSAIYEEIRGLLDQLGGWPQVYRLMPEISPEDWNAMALDDVAELLRSKSVPQCVTLSRRCDSPPCQTDAKIQDEMPSPDIEGGGGSLIALEVGEHSPLAPAKVFKNYQRISFFANEANTPNRTQPHPFQIPILTTPASFLVGLSFF